MRFYYIPLIIALFAPFLSEAQLTANFTVSNQQACGNLAAFFTNTSTGAYNQSQWTFTNTTGGASPPPTTVTNPGVPFGPGTYDVCLTVRNTSTGTTNTLCRTAYIQVNARPSAIITVNDSIGCPPFTVNFTSASTQGTCPIVTCQWNFGDGNTSTNCTATNTYPTVGTFSPTLIVTDACGCTDFVSLNNFIRVQAAPVAGFTFGGTLTACTPPIVVNFNNTSTGNNLAYNWSFGDPASGAANTSTAVNPNHTYTVSGIYPVNLTVTDVVAGCTSTFSDNVNVFIGSSSLSFTASDTSICLGESVNFTSSIPAGAVANNLSWDFGDTNTSTATNTSHTYATAGAFVVRLTGDVNGCPASFTRNILVATAPTASPTSNITNDCRRPLSVNFTANTTNATTWAWSFGDPVSGALNTSAAQNPTHIFNNYGTYDVRLVASNAAGCSVTSSLTISTNPLIASMSLTDSIGCAPLSTSISGNTNSSAPITQWSWRVTGQGITPIVGNTQNLNVTVPNPGCYNVGMTITNALGCTATYTATDTICAGQQLAVNYSATPLSACAEEEIAFTNLTTGGPQRVRWAFGDGGFSTQQNPTHEYGDIDSFEVCLTVTNYGCDSTLCRDTVVINGPIADFDVQRSCDPDSLFIVVFDNESIRANRYHWNFGTGNPADTSNLENPTFDFTAAGRGLYNVELIAYNDTSGCEFPFTLQVAITVPQANFTVAQDTGCATFNLNLTSTFQDATTYAWSGIGSAIGGGNTATPTISYPTPGRYPAPQVIITDVNGCQDTAVGPPIVIDGITPGFTISNIAGCLPLTSTFTDTSRTFLGSIVSWQWDLDNGSRPTTQTATTTYNALGTFNTALTVTNSFGCTATVNSPNGISVTFPQPDFSMPDTSCTTNTITFLNLTQGTSNMTYRWTFGTGVNADTSNLAAPTFTYSTDGNYNVCMTVTDQNGCTASLCKPIVIITPVASFSSVATLLSCPGDGTTFTNLSQNARSCFWTFGNGATSNLCNPGTINYLAVGNYDVTLQVTGVPGCVSTLTRPGYIQVQGPVVTVTSPTAGICLPGTVVYDYTWTDADSFVIFFGDGSFQLIDPATQSGSASFTNTFNELLIPGSNRATTSIFAFSNSCSNVSYTGPTIIMDSLSTSFTVSDSVLCNTGCVNYQSLIQTNSNNLASDWLFTGGNPSTANTQNATVCYSASGVYSTRLIVNTDYCRDTISLPNALRVTSDPVAGFTASPTSGCTPLTVSFTNTTTGPDPVRLFWDFNNDGVVDDSTSTNPNHVYSTPGTTTASLTAVSTAGCSNTFTLPITVNGLPGNILGADRVICLGDTVSITASGVALGWSYTWRPDASIITTNNETITANPSVATSYIVTVTDVNGCQASDTVRVSVNSLPVVNAGNDTSACLNTVIPLRAIGSGGSGTGYTYAWSTGDNTRLAPYLVTGSVVLTCSITDSNGCRSADNISVTALALPVVSATASPDSICNGFTSTLTASQVNGVNPMTYIWSNGVTANSITVSPPTPAAWNNYTVIGIDGNTCRDTAAVGVYLNPLPPLSVSIDTNFICINDRTIIRATAPTAATYAWSPNNGTLNNANAAVVVASPTTTTTYTVLITDAQGCQASASITLGVSPFALPVISITPDTTICYGRYVQLNVSGGLAYDYHDWFNIPGLSCYTNCVNPVATPLTTTTYYVLVEGNGGCRDTAQVTVTVRDERFDVLGPDRTICLGDSAQLNILGGTNPRFTGVDLSCVVCPNPFAFPSNTSEYFVNVTQNGCPVDDSIMVNVIRPDMVSAGRDTFICRGDSILLVGMGTDSTLWQPFYNIADSSQLSTLVWPDTTTSYVLSAFGANCAVTDTVVISVYNTAEITAEDVSVCPGFSVQLNASGIADRFEWAPASGLDNPNIPNPIATVSDSSVFVVTGFLGNCPSDQEVVNVNVTPPVDLPGVRVKRFFVGQQVIVDLEDYFSTDGLGVQWVPNTYLGNCDTCTSAVIRPDTAITYTITVTDSIGCQSSMQLRLIPVEECGEGLVVVPNAFTPNGDGNNDVLFARSSSIGRILNFDVYDRWGKRIFNTNNLNVGWDGTADGANAESGVYVYHLQYICPLDNSTITVTGNVTLIR